MTGLFAKLFGSGNSATGAASKYETAMEISDELHRRMMAHSTGSDPARGVMADIWSQRNNVPFMTTVVEAVAEAGAAIQQRPEDLTS